MASAVVHYTASALTDRGRKRASNEDAFGISNECGVYVVCDGMGGAAAGEVASTLAVAEVMRLLTDRAGTSSLPGVNSLSAEAEQAVAAANQAIFTRSQRNQKLSGMGTTLVALLVENSHAWILNVGDSRCYRLRSSHPDSHIEQITLDHSLVEEQIRLGQMSRLEALHSPLKNVITRALGTQSSVSPDVFELETEAGDLFLLCSDGLTRELSDTLLDSILHLDLPLESLCSRLVAAANEAGGHDNITCLLVRAEA